MLLGRQLRALIEQRAVAAYPLEGCGLLVGLRRGRITEVVRVASSDNLASYDPERRYELDPAVFLATERAAREDGLEVVGFWHSHPDKEPLPSATDLETAWRGYSYVIVSATGRGAGELRSWRLGGQRFLEEAIGETCSDS